MLASVLRLPFACGFVMILLVSVVLLLLLGPTTGWAQGPVGANDQGWIPIQGGYEPHSLAPIGSSDVAPQSKMESPGGKAPPSDANDGNQVANGRQGASAQSVGEDLRGMLAPSGPAAYGSPLVIPAADFRNNGLSTDRYFIKLGEDGFGGYFTTTGGVVCMMAPAHLPVLTRVTQIWGSVFDNGGATRPWVNFYRMDNFNATLPSDLIGSILSSGTSVNIQNLYDTGIVNPIVYQPQFSYYVGGCVYDTQQRIYSVRLYYAWP